MRSQFQPSTAIGLPSGRRRSGWLQRAALASGLLWVVWTAPGWAQALRYDYYRDLSGGRLRYREDLVFGAAERPRSPTKQPPDYATVCIGPFYSTVVFSQSAGYRYVRTSGVTADFLSRNRRGVYVKDGSEIPLITTLDFRNYLLITEHMDLDVSFRVGYEYYPLGTQENDFYVDMVEEGMYATLSTAFEITPFVTAVAYDSLAYITDYIDKRGISDRFGGQRYRSFQNQAGLRLDWRLAQDKDVMASALREDFIPKEDRFKDQQRVTYREGVNYQQTVVGGFSVGARAAYSQTSYTASDRDDWNQSDYSVYADYAAGIDRGQESGLRLLLSPFTSMRGGVGYSAGASLRRGAAVTETGEQVTEGQGARVGAVTGFASLTTRLRSDLSHTFDFRRGLWAGYNTAYERFTEYGYRIDWVGALSRAGAFTKLRQVETESKTVPNYEDWASGVTASYPLTSYATLYMSSIYSERRNRGVRDEALVRELEAEWWWNYSTWATRVGTSFRVTQHISFRTSVEHTVRTSTHPDLEYSRDVFDALFTYRREL